jgi:hypothetical protein
MKKLFILSLCFMFFVQNVEAGILCGKHKKAVKECLAEKSTVKNEAEQHEFWRNILLGTTVVATITAGVFGYKLYMKRQELALANREIVSKRNLIDALRVDLDRYIQSADRMDAILNQHH